jgi:hypothetical protein
MVKARRDFLQAGYYQPLCEAASQLLAHSMLNIYWILAVAKAITLKVLANL